MSHQPEVEDAVQSACARGDYADAAARALEAYGAEILSFLAARLRSRSAADETFAMFAEDLWKGLPGFGFRCSTRSWLYAVARNAANRYSTAPQNRAQRNLPICEDPRISQIALRVRTATNVYQRTDVKDRFRALREQLPLEDQTLLVLHVDRGLEWRELAMVMHDQGDTLSADELERESARLRKRFERMKGELRRLATKSGLLKPESM